MQKSINISGAALSKHDAETAFLTAEAGEPPTPDPPRAAPGPVNASAAALPSRDADTAFLTAEAADFDIAAAAAQSGQQYMATRVTRGAGSLEFPFNHKPQPIPDSTARTEQTVAVSQCLPSALEGLERISRCGESTTFATNLPCLSQWEHAAPAAHAAAAAQRGNAHADVPASGKARAGKDDDASAKRIEGLIARAGTPTL